MILPTVSRTRTQQFATAALALAVLLLAFLLGRHPSSMLLMLLAGVLLALFLLRRPELGIVAVLVSALVVPFSIGTGTQTRLHAALLLIPLLLVLWLLDMVMRHEARIVPSSTNTPLLIFVLSAAVSFVAGNMPWNYFAVRAPITAQVGGLIVFGLSAAVYLLVANRVNDVRWLKSLVSAFLALGALVVLGRLAPPLNAVVGRLVVSGAVGALFWVWLTALAGGQAIFNPALLQLHKVLLLGLATAGPTLNFLLNRGWASGWAPAMAAMLALIWLRSWRVGFIVTVLGLLGVLMLRPELPTDLVAADEYSIVTRQAAWEVILGQVIRANPVIGLGPANYYHYASLYPIMGYYLRFNSHNQYIDIIAQTGLVGLAVFSWLMAAIGLQAWRLRTRVTDGFALGYVCACLAGLVGSLAAGWFADWFLPFVYNIGLAGTRASLLGWMFLGGLVVISRQGDA